MPARATTTASPPDAPRQRKSNLRCVPAARRRPILSAACRQPFRPPTEATLTQRPADLASSPRLVRNFFTFVKRRLRALATLASSPPRWQVSSPPVLVRALSPDSAVGVV